MKNRSVYIYLSWVIAVISFLGSLFFSEIMEFPPCTLCWYQRIAMYPLVFIFMIGAIKDSKDTFIFSLPLVAIGWIISVYHNLLHYEILPEKLAPCKEGVSCSTVYIELFGFLTIPMMSFIAFSLLILIQFLFKRLTINEK